MDLSKMKRYEKVAMDRYSSQPKIMVMSHREMSSLSKL